MNVVIFSRVSTQIQDYQRQTDELKEYAQKNGYEVLHEFEEKISGGKKNSDRPALSEMIEYIKAHKVDKVLAWELSRIGRNALQVLKFIEQLNDLKVSLYIKNFNIETLDENLEVNPLSSFMINILNSVSDMEKSTIRMRMKSGYDNYRNNRGGKVGRKEGYRKNDDTFLMENKRVVKYLKQGLSIRQVMKLTDKSSGTVQKVKRLIL